MKYRESLSLVSSQLENKLDPLKGIESLGLPCIARQSFLYEQKKCCSIYGCVVVQ